MKTPSDLVEFASDMTFVNARNFIYNDEIRLIDKEHKGYEVSEETYNRIMEYKKNHDNEGLKKLFFNLKLLPK